MQWTADRRGCVHFASCNHCWAVREGRRTVAQQLTRADAERIAASHGAAGDLAALREALDDLLRWSLSDQESRLLIVMTGGSSAVDGPEPGASLHQRCDRIRDARARAEIALAAASPAAPDGESDHA